MDFNPFCTASTARLAHKDSLVLLDAQDRRVTPVRLANLDTQDATEIRELQARLVHPDQLDRKDPLACQERRYSVNKCGSKLDFFNHRDAMRNNPLAAKAHAVLVDRQDLKDRLEMQA